MKVKLLTSKEECILPLGKLVTIEAPTVSKKHRYNNPINEICVDINKTTLYPERLTFNSMILGHFAPSVERCLRDMGRDFNLATINEFSIRLIASYNEDGTLESGPQKRLLEEVYNLPKEHL